MLLIDTYNLYNGAYARYKRRIDYDRLIHYLKSRDCTLNPRYAYVADTGQSSSFVKYLRSRQFVVRTKIIRENKSDTFDVDLSIEAMHADVNEMVICSSSLNLLPLIRSLTDNGVIVTIQSCGIPACFKDYCNAYELPLGVMDETEQRQTA